jgi:coproporphyrinogen III oxidase
MNRVQKFRSLEDMARAAVQVSPGDGFERFARHCARYFALTPRVYPRGVFRFRTMEEAQAARERVTVDNLRFLPAQSRTS